MILEKKILAGKDADMSKIVLGLSLGWGSIILWLMTQDIFFLVHWFGNLTLENTDSITCQLVALNILIVIGNLVLGRSREILEYFNKRER